jgi:hypothetical protein
LTISAIYLLLRKRQKRQKTRGAPELTPP